MSPKSRARSGALLVSTLTALAVGPPAGGQELVPPSRGGFTSSLGFPPSFHPHLTLSMGLHGESDSDVGVGAVGLGFYKDLTNPVMSLLGVMVDGYGAARTDGSWDGGLQAQLHMPLFRLAAGVDYSIADDQADFILSLVHPLRRGGVVFDGGKLRASWLPGRGHSFSVGIQVPLATPLAGRGRPPREKVMVRPVKSSPIPDPIRMDSLLPAVNEVIRLANLMDRLLVPFLDVGGSPHDEALANLGRSFEEVRQGLAGTPGAPDDAPTAQGVVLAYHRSLVDAFAVALEPDMPEANATAERIAQAARTALLDEVLLPHNSLLGQYRDVKTLQPFLARARGAFVRLVDEGGVLEDVQRWRAEWVFDRFASDLEELRRVKEEQWGDERMVWLPLQLALLPEDHDEQEELDRLVERAAGVQFRSGNDVDYILNERFQWALHQSIHEAQDYHVLWVHDIQGYDGDGNPDQVSFDQVRHGYLQTLLERIQAYDRTGRLPEYHIFLDQWFYEVNKGRIWLEVLENPLDHRIDLPEGFEAWEAELDSVQDALAQAVIESRRLQSEARAYGQDWLKNRIKVHVHITNQPDHSFWSSQIMPIFGLPDDALRDHRKIVLWDLTEEDPARGGLMLTGMGVGEHYAGTHWEDRAVMIRGPAALYAKQAAREHLLEQGLTEEQVPWVLRPLEMPLEAFSARVEGDVTDIRATQLHNAVGFGQKQVSVAKAMMYSLMEPGSVLKAPDSLWNHPLWASLLLGSALRGGRVLIISPALANAPAAGWPQMSRAYELMSRMVLVQSLLESNLRSAGGLIRVGLYNPDVGVGDIPARIERFLETMDRETWLADLYGFHPLVVDSLRAVSADLRGRGFQPDYLTYDWTDDPKLHIKANLMASREGWDHLLGQPEWAVLMAEYFRGRADHVSQDDRFVDFHELPREMAPIMRRMGERFFGEMDPETYRRVEYYLLVGSHNQDYRSMLLDGEVELMISGLGIVVGLEDFLLLPGLTAWIETDEELQELLPRPGELRRRIARIIRTAL